MWPDAEKTEELLRRARGGDDGAVDRLLTRHREAVRRLIEMRLDRAIAARVDASDIAQEALIEAHRRLPEYLADPAMPFHLWIRQIARDRLIDAHRRHRGARKRSVEKERRLESPKLDHRSSVALLAQLEDRRLTPAAAAIREEFLKRFEAALGKIGEDDREIILLRHYEGLPSGEAARVLGLSEPAAGMRYLRALRRLRALLEPGEGE